MKLDPAILIPKQKYRPKKQIVDQWEIFNAHFIVGGRTIACPENCMCTICFNAALDRLVAKTEADANAMRASLGVNDDMASDGLTICAESNGLDTVQHFDRR